MTRRVLAVVFGAHAQVVIGAVSFVVGGMLWTLGLFIVPGAFSWPWHWTVTVFILHASMFFGLVACYAIVSTGLGYRAVEQVPRKVVEAVVDADAVNITVER